jgi:hypothetical protein
LFREAVEALDHESVFATLKRAPRKQRCGESNQEHKDRKARRAGKDAQRSRQGVVSLARKAR